MGRNRRNNRRIKRVEIQEIKLLDIERERLEKERESDLIMEEICRQEKLANDKALEDAFYELIAYNFSDLEKNIFSKDVPFLKYEYEIMYFERKRHLSYQLKRPQKYP